MPSMNEAVKRLSSEVLTTEAHRGNPHAENVVHRLSGMYEFVVNNAPEQAEGRRACRARFCGKVFDGELSFCPKLAREMGRSDWRAMLLPGCHPRSMPTGTALQYPLFS